jgi:hypothetical protein
MGRLSPCPTIDVSIFRQNSSNRLENGRISTIKSSEFVSSAADIRKYLLGIDLESFGDPQEF